MDPARVELVTGTVGAARGLHQAGFALVAVTHQPGIALGQCTEGAVLDVAEKVHALLAEGGVTLDGYYYCPHHPNGSVSKYAVSCLCRKPAPGLLIRAAQELDLDLRRSWMIGGPADVEAGHRARLLTVLLSNGISAPRPPGLGRDPDYVAANIVEAARTIRSASTSYPFALPKGA